MVSTIHENVQECFDVVDTPWVFSGDLLSASLLLVSCSFGVKRLLLVFVTVFQVLE